jgi:AcrR family transcriptional regulator
MALERANPLRPIRHGDRPRAHTGDSDPERAVFAALGRLLEQVPLRDISVNQIISEAQISRATFYFYFSSKFAVVTGLTAVVLEELSQAIEPALRASAEDDDPIQPLRRRLEAMAAVWVEHRAIMRAVAENWQAVPELAAIWLDMIESSTDGLSREIDRNRAARGEPLGPGARGLAAVVVWATERLLYVSGLGRPDDLPSEREAVEVLLPLWAAAIYG